jgi:hypothetical protein
MNWPSFFQGLKITAVFWFSIFILVCFGLHRRGQFDVKAMLRKRVNWIRRRDFKVLVSFITPSIALVALHVAIGFFTPKHSVFIRVPDNSWPGYNKDLFMDYYHQNHIELPRILLKDNSLQNLFPQSDTRLGWYRVGPYHPSDQDIVKALAEGQTIHDKNLQDRIERLEKHTGKYTYKKLMYQWFREFPDKKTVASVCDQVKSKLSSHEYFIFLAALNRSKEIPQNVAITNTGDVDLKHVQIIIHAPMSKVAETRDNNIIKHEVVDIAQIFYKTIEDSRHLEYHLPLLKKNEAFGIYVTTRENQLSQDDIIVSYERDQTIDDTMRYIIYAYLFCVLMAMLLLNWFFKGRTTKHG